MISLFKVELTTFKGPCLGKPAATTTCVYQVFYRICVQLLKILLHWHGMILCAGPPSTKTWGSKSTEVARQAKDQVANQAKD